VSMSLLGDMRSFKSLILFLISGIEDLLEGLKPV
jgi:hypothetical protein